MIRAVWGLVVVGAIFILAAALLFNLGSGPGAFWGFLGLGLIGCVVWAMALVVTFGRWVR